MTNMIILILFIIVSYILIYSYSKKVNKKFDNLPEDYPFNSTLEEHKEKINMEKLEEVSRSYPLDDQQFIDGYKRLFNESTNEELIYYKGDIRRTALSSRNRQYLKTKKALLDEEFEKRGLIVIQKRDYIHRHKIVKLRDKVWARDIPHPTIPEYVELHEKIQATIKDIEELLGDPYDGHN